MVEETEVTIKNGKAAPSSAFGFTNGMETKQLDGATYYVAGEEARKQLVTEKGTLLEVDGKTYEIEEIDYDSALVNGGQRQIQQELILREDRPGQGKKRNQRFEPS